MKKLKLIGVILISALVFVGCEKETDLESNFSKANTKKNNLTKNKLATKEKKAKRDSNGSLKKCKSTPKDCAVFVIMPTDLELGGTFFTSDGVYIPNSFVLNYTTALQYFTTSEIDNVINQDYTVYQVSSDDVIFIVFQDSNEEDVSVYQYGE
mgnify:FL=1